MRDIFIGGKETEFADVHNADRWYKVCNTLIIDVIEM